MLTDGSLLRTENGDDVTVEKQLGSGGQGEVYRVRTPDGPQALKWYYPQLADTGRREILESLVYRDWGDDRFLWPQTIVTDYTGAGLGYLMPLRPDRFHDLPALLRRDPAVAATPRSLVTAALHTVEAYQALHAKGIAYRDISWGNIFFDPANGDVLICDNDNAVMEGQGAGIAGTINFMAPELVRNDPGAQPGTQSDLHSLAVLLFYLLMNHHPLNGALELKIRCMDDKAQRKLYGTDPVFVYDPRDTRNRPVRGEQDTVITTWGLLPQLVKDLFVTTFTDGLHSPAQRVREGEWREALSAARDAIVPCASCGRQNLTQPGGAAPQCWKCGTAVAPPLRLEVTTGIGGRRSRRNVLLSREAQLYAHHLEAEPQRHDFTAVVGEVTPHPKKPGVFGLTNRSNRPWTLRRQDGTETSVDPARTTALRAGAMLEFGDGADGVIHDA